MTTRADKLSVVLCTYNGAAYLNEQLESIRRQTRLPDSVLIVDDCSTDNTVSIAGEFSRTASFPVRVVLNEANLGYVRNFDKAIRLADGELIVLCDQDDVWFPDRLELTEAALRQAPDAGMVFGDAELVDSTLRPLGRCLRDALGFTTRRQREFDAGLAFPRLLNNYHVTGATMAFRAKYRDLVLPIPDGVYHDAWIALLVAAVADVEFVPKLLIKYRQHTQNQVGVGSTNLLEIIQRRRRVGRSACRILLRQAVSARNRLQQKAAAMPAWKHSVLDEAVAHLTIRENLPEQRIRRIRPVLEQLMARRYGGSYGGLRAGIGDLL